MKSPAAALASVSPAATSATDDEEEMVQPRAASLGTRSRTQSPERLDERAEAETRAARLEREQAEMRQELLRLEEELRRERQRTAAKEQAPLSDELRRQLVANLWEAVKDKREKNTGKGAKEPWKNFKVHRELVACAFMLDDVGRSLSIARGVVKVNDVERAVLWGEEVPDDVLCAEILDVEERIGGRIEVQVRGAVMPLENPAAGLVADVLSFMGKVKGQAGIWRPLAVSFEGEDGKDDGGLSEEMFGAFWKGVTSEEFNLFECAAGFEQACAPAFLPKAGACTHSLEMVGRMLCKSLINYHPTGPGLGRFVFDFLLEAEGEPSRAFAETEPIREQAETAIVSLSHFDAQYALMYHRYLREETGELRTTESLMSHLHLSGMPLPKLCDIVLLNEGHRLANEIVTVDNLPNAIVASSRWILRESRLAQLEAMRRGFTCYVDVTTQLRLMPSPDVMLVVQGRPDMLSAEQLIAQIEWPDTTDAQKVKDGEDHSVAERAEFSARLEDVRATQAR